MKKKFTAYADPGHAWVKVSRDLLKDLGILNQITGCSYQRGNDVYLEEDCDLYTFHKAYVARFDVKPVYKSEHTNKQSRIRNYESFSPNVQPVTAKTIAVGLRVKIYGLPYTVTEKTHRGWRVVSESGAQYLAQIHQMKLAGE